jgi:hypothetical protein
MSCTEAHFENRGDTTASRAPTHRDTVYDAAHFLSPRDRGARRTEGAFTRASRSLARRQTLR